MFIDSHCHLDRLDLNDFDNNLDNVISAAQAVNVEKILCVSVKLADFQSMADKTNHYNNVMLSCGAHPLNQEEAISA